MTADPEQLEAQIAEAAPADREALRKLAKAIKRRRQGGQPFDKLLAKLASQVADSTAKAKRREHTKVHLEYDEQLPIVGRRQEILDLIAAHQVVIVCGETGSGKSTQLPKFCLELGRGLDCLIGHTQPRRIAARSVAARVAEELQSPLGQVAGFKTRFAEALSEITRVKLMTDGILLAETQSDPLLSAYDTLIIDEAHERSLNIDFLLGLIKRILPQRPDLRLIITSATIDAQRFAEHFTLADGQPAPVIEVSGRAYPVEVRYRPLVGDDDSDETEADHVEALRSAVRELASIDSGDILIFMPTEHGIREAARHLRGMNIPGDGPADKTEILPLYARLSVAEQNRVFQPHRGRRIVLATNVAESSLTVPGIRSVIDTGTARLSRYSPRSKVQRLPIEAISRASADQRAGRCGRIAPGVCIRMYSREDYEARDRYTQPEIQRTNLAAVILQTLAFRLGPIEEFPFLDPPKPAAIRDGYKTLFELGALDAADQLTPLGKRLSRLPVDPRIGRMILAAAEERCLAEVLVIAAALEVNDPRERPVERQGSADEAHARHQDPASDFLGILKLWRFTHGLQEELSRSRFRKALQQNFISFNRLREWHDVHRQLRQTAQDAGLPVGSSAGSATESGTPGYAAIHRALLTGLLSNVAFKSERHEYLGSGGMRLNIWPGSGVFASKPQWLMAAELVETTRRYARTIARIEPEWIEAAAPHLVKHSYSDPRWDRQGATAIADERVSLFGLPVVPRRRIRLGKLDPITAREIFIEHALVQGDFETKARMLKRNAQTLAEAQALQAKTRRYDLLGDERDVYKFYDRRLPREVVDGVSFDKWWRKDQQAAENQLSMTLDDLLQAELSRRELEQQFPDRMEVPGLSLPLAYRFAPGEADDGVSVVVPQAAVHQLDERRLGWLVPGLWEQQVTAMIKSLPKPLRVNLVPAPQTAAAVVKNFVAKNPRPTDAGFVAAVAEELSRLGGARVTPVDFDPASWPEHLRVNVRVVDERGKLLNQGRDLATLRQEVGGDLGAELATLDHPDWNRTGLKEWAWQLLPQSVEVRQHGMTLRGFPAIVDAGDAVATRLAPTLDIAEAETRGGIRRLLVIRNWRNLKQQIEYHPRYRRMVIHAAHLSSFDLNEELALAAVDQAFLAEGPLPRTAEAFNQLQQRRKGFVSIAVQDVIAVAEPLFAALHEASVAVNKLKHPNFAAARGDIQEQLADLTRPGFLRNTPWETLQHYPRYLRGIVTRLEKLNSGGLGKDQQNLKALRPYWTRYQTVAAECRERNVADAALERFRWMLEEYRISLFAQALGTAEPVSPKRLDAQWEKVGG